MYLQASRTKLALFVVAAGMAISAQELSSTKLRDLDFPPSVFANPVRPESIDPKRWSATLQHEVSREWIAAAERWSKIAEDSETAGFYLRSAACYLRADAYPEAFRELNHSIALSPARTATEEHLRALAHWESGDFRQAWKILITLIRSEDTVGMHHYHLLTRVALSQNARAEAIGWARKVAEKGTLQEREAFFNNPAFTVLEQSRLYALMKKDALDSSRSNAQENEGMSGEELFEFWQISLSLTNHTFSATNSTMQLTPFWRTN